MHKIVIDTGRVYGYFDGNKKWGKKVSEDYDESGLYGHAPIARFRQYGYDCKDLGDRIGPLRRYLRSCVGRHWDDVYSELRKALPKGMHYDHIWGHVTAEIAIQCVEGADGKIYEMGKYGNPTVVYGLYVHPKTRRVCKAEDRNERKIYRKRAVKEHADRVATGKIPLTIKGKSYCCYDGIWYHVWREEHEEYLSDLDRVVKIRTNHKRQLNRRDLKELGLKNTV